MTPNRCDPFQLNFSQIRVFHAVVKCGNYSRAAEHLDISQPAVSLQIKSMEQKIGKHLLRRKGRQVILTDAGRRVMRSASQIVSLMTELNATFDSQSAVHTGQVTIGITSPYFLKLVAALIHRFPEMRIRILLSNTEEMYDHLHHFRVETALVTQTNPRRGFFNHRFFEQRIYACLPQDHPWTAQETVGLEELCQEPLIYRETGSMTQRIFEKAVATHGLDPAVALRVSTREAVKEAVACGLGVGFVFDVEFGCDARLAAVPISDADLRAWQYLVCMENLEQTRLVQDLIRIADAFSPAGDLPATTRRY